MIFLGKVSQLFTLLFLKQKKNIKSVLRFYFHINLCLKPMYAQYY